MPKIVLNKSSGCFQLSNLAIIEYFKLNNMTPYYYRLTTLLDNKYQKCSKAMFLNNDIPEHYKYIANKDLGNSVKVTYDFFNYMTIPRHDKNLVKVVETLAKRADGICSKLVVIKIPTKIKYQIIQVQYVEYAIENGRIW